MRHGKRQDLEAHPEGRGRLLRTGLGTAALRLAYLLLQFGSGVLIARGLGPEAFGSYAFTVAVVQILVVVAAWGFPSFLVRRVTQALSGGDALAVRPQLRVAATTVLFTAALVCAGTGSWLLLNGGPDGSSLAVGLLLVAPLALTSAFGGAIQGLGHVVLGQLPDMIVRPALLLVSFSLLLLLGVRPGAEDALLLHAVASGAAMVLAVWLVLRRLPPVPSGAVLPPAHWLGTWRVALPFLLMALANAAQYQMDILVLGTLLPSEEVGHYRVAVQVTDGLMVVMFSISASIAPQIARLQAKGRLDEAARLCARSHRVATLVLLPPSLLIALGSERLLALVYGPAYAEAAGALTILALSKVAYATVGFAGLVLAMLGRADAATVITMATLGLNAALNLLLIPLYGIEGAAIAVASSQLIVNVAAQIWLRVAFNRAFSVLGATR